MSYSDTSLKRPKFRRARHLYAFLKRLLGLPPAQAFDASLVSSRLCFMPPRLTYVVARETSRLRAQLPTLVYAPSRSYSAASASLALPLRISDLRSRIGKCIIFGLKDKQVDEAGAILRDIGKGWKGLVAGSEGYSTETEGVRREVNWGDMVSDNDLLK